MRGRYECGRGLAGLRVWLSRSGHAVPVVELPADGLMEDGRQHGCRCHWCAGRLGHDKRRHAADWTRCPSNEVPAKGGGKVGAGDRTAPGDVDDGRGGVPDVWDVWPAVDASACCRTRPPSPIRRYPEAFPGVIHVSPTKPRAQHPPEHDVDEGGPVHLHLALVVLHLQVQQQHHQHHKVLRPGGTQPKDVRIASL